MSITEIPEPALIDELREGLIAELRALGALRTSEVERAIRTVPRHLFVPGETLEQAYAAEYAPVVKKDEHGVTLSSVSAVRIQAFMLEQADVRPGMRVLEVGSGGYNAALIAELAGDAGEITTLDIDPDVVDRASALLRVAGYSRVRAIVADGDGGEPRYAPYDRIIVTVEAAELASAWASQLTESGRIVVPLRMRGLTRSVSFQRESNYLTARDYEVCGFVPMRGTGASRQHLVVLHDGEGDEVGLRLDDQPADARALAEALRQPREMAWTGVTMGRGQPYDDLDLWLATVLPGYGLLAATRRARERGLVASWSPMGVSALIAGDSFAYLTMRPTSFSRQEFEFGAVAHGPRAQQAAEDLAEQIYLWDRDHRGSRAEFRAYPAGTPDEELPRGRVLGKAGFRIVICWPAAR